MAEDEKKKKKTPGIIEQGKALYQAYMRRRREMQEIKPKIPTGPETLKVEPEKPEPQAAQPPKKKKKPPRGGVGGVLDLIEERKRRMREVMEE
jgi:hypothetical protein